MSRSQEQIKNEHFPHGWIYSVENPLEKGREEHSEGEEAVFPAHNQHQQTHDYEIIEESAQHANDSSSATRDTRQSQTQLWQSGYIGSASTRDPTSTVKPLILVTKTSPSGRKALRSTVGLGQYDGDENDDENGSGRQDPEPSTGYARRPTSIGTSPISERAYSEASLPPPPYAYNARTYPLHYDTPAGPRITWYHSRLPDIPRANYPKQINVQTESPVRRSEHLTSFQTEPRGHVAIIANTEDDGYVSVQERETLTTSEVGPRQSSISHENHTGKET